MNRRALPLPALLLVALTAGCGAGTPTTAAPTTASAQTPTTQAGSPASAPASAPAEPIGEEQREFVDAVAAVEPALAKDPTLLVRTAENSCAELNAPDPSAALEIENAVKQLSRGTKTLTNGQALRIVEAARRTICKP